MNTALCMVKELAAELRMSVKSIPRAYRSGEIPVPGLRRMARFDLAQVRQAMERNGQGRVQRLKRHREEALRDRRHVSAARTARRPPTGKTGACIAAE